MCVYIIYLCMYINVCVYVYMCIYSVSIFSICILHIYTYIQFYMSLEIATSDKQLSYSNCYGIFAVLI